MMALPRDARRRLATSRAFATLEGTQVLTAAWLLRDADTQDVSELLAPGAVVRAIAFAGQRAIIRRCQSDSSRPT